jgi:hypothetical protein
MIKIFNGARGSVVVWENMLQAGRSQAQFPMGSADYSIELIFQPHYGPGINSPSIRNEYHESSGGIGRPAREAVNPTAISEPIF